jgi:hypothetical protein
MQIFAVASHMRLFTLRYSMKLQYVNVNWSPLPKKTDVGLPRI